MEGPIVDEVKISIRPVNTLLEFSPELRFVPKNYAIKNQASILKGVLLNSQQHLYDLETYLILTADKFKEAFEEYKLIYNTLYYEHSKPIQQVLDREYKRKKVRTV